MAAKLNKHITSPLHSYGSSSSNEAVIKLLARERNREGERERDVKEQRKWGKEEKRAEEGCWAADLSSLCTWGSNKMLFGSQ